jgi:hypothetical protein
MFRNSVGPANERTPVTSASIVLSPALDGECAEQRDL